MAYSDPARTETRRTRSTILTALVVVSATLVGVLLICQALASSSSPAALFRLVTPPATSPSPSDTGHGHRELGEADGAVPAGVTVFDDEIPAVANLDPHFLGALRRAATAAADDGVQIFVNSGWRSPAYQDQLLREAISEYGSEGEAARWVATRDTSPHVSGDAIDVGHSDATAWLSKHGAKYGLCQIYGNEPWHYELRTKAIDNGCPPKYADPTHDPRMQQ